MSSEPTPLRVLDLTGTFAFGLDGALTAVRAARLDVVGVIVLGLITALGGGFVRDVLIGSLPPTTRVRPATVDRHPGPTAPAGTRPVPPGGVRALARRCRRPRPRSPCAAVPPPVPSRRR
ncbi:trimeric intracellular cation channel family protein [Streptomyces sp. AD55]|uniref:trimeric intracellular cation channel family protein n=1 Tax=Streptomyces sp. AD55 TaxID=3242895 RepID=UPI0035278642